MVKVGDTIKVVNAKLAEGRYKNGDILTVEQILPNNGVYVKEHNRCLWESEYEPYNPIKVGDTVRLIDKFYEHEVFKNLERYQRKDIFNQSGKELKATYILGGGVCYTAENQGIMAIPVELLEKVEQLPKAPKQGDLFKVIGRTSPIHGFPIGDEVKFTGEMSIVGRYTNGVYVQWVCSADLEPTKHRYTADQIAEAERIIGEIVAGFGEGECFYVLNVTTHGIAIRYRTGMNDCYGRFDSRCSPHDEFNRTIGIMVALCRATGRKLPDWMCV